jgi:hypothetical protein
LGQSASLLIDDSRELARAWRLTAIQAVLTLLPALLLLGRHRQSASPRTSLH